MNSRVFIDTPKFTEHDHRFGKIGYCFTLVLFALIVGLSAAGSSLANEVHDAVIRGDLQTVNSLLSSDGSKDLVEQQNAQGLLPIHLAVIHEQRDILPELLRMHTIADVPDRYGRTPLMFAVSSRDTVVSGYLLRRNASVLAKDKGGSTPLHFAVQAGSSINVELLLERNVSVDALDGRGMTPLMMAIDQENLELAKRILRAGAAPNSRNDRGLAPIHIATIRGERQLIDLMLDNFADVNLRVNGNADRLADGATALHLAVLYNQPETFQTLLSAGANSRITNKVGLTPLMLAIHLGEETLTNRLLGLSAFLGNLDGDLTPMMMALQREDRSLINRLIDQGASPDEKFSNELTPLLYAIEHEKPALVRILLERGANPDLGNGRVVPLQSAISKVNLTLVEILLEHDADPNIVFPSDQSFFGRVSSAISGDHGTPLQLAIEHDTVPIASLLIKHGADVNKADPNSGQTPLARAVVKGLPEMVRLLVVEGSRIPHSDDLDESVVADAINQGGSILQDILKAKDIDLNAVDTDSAGYLHFAVRKNPDPQILKTLAMAGVDINHADISGQTPLHIAARRGEAEAAATLIELGSDPSAVDKQGRRPLDIARGDALTILGRITF